jgi:hypothetical protein
VPHHSSIARPHQHPRSRAAPADGRAEEGRRRPGRAGQQPSSLASSGAAPEKDEVEPHCLGEGRARQRLRALPARAWFRSCWKYWARKNWARTALCRMADQNIHIGKWPEIRMEMVWYVQAKTIPYPIRVVNGYKFLHILIPRVKTSIPDGYPYLLCTWWVCQIVHKLLAILNLSIISLIKK